MTASASRGTAVRLNSRAFVDFMRDYFAYTPRSDSGIFARPPKMRTLPPGPIRDSSFFGALFRARFFIGLDCTTRPRRSQLRFPGARNGVRTAGVGRLQPLR